jgi:opine dehydrogenase
MNKIKYNICVCGGGNISHAIAGTMAYKGHKINILTRNPECWNKKIDVLTPTINYSGVLNIISNDPKDVIPNSNIIIISVPTFAIENILNKINPFLTDKMTIIGIPGRLYSQYNKNLNNINQIYILRTPYISRINLYGNNVSITGYCFKELSYWSNCSTSEEILKSLFSFKFKKIDNLMSIDLVNSNSILHPSRLYAIFKNKKAYIKPPLFYKDWCLESSKNLIECDNELSILIKNINNDTHVKNKVYVKPILEHYDSSTDIELTNKIRSITSLAKPKTPMIEKEGLFYCDYKNRYITEDIFMGMNYILNLANVYSVDLPKINEIYNFFVNFK